MRIGILVAACLLVFAATPFGVAQAAPDWRDAGPRSLLVTYKVKPADKTRMRTALTAKLLPRLNRLKSDGELSRFHVLANRYLDSGSWDFMLILDFKSDQALGRWRDVEARTPGGLDPQALRFVSEATSAPADPMFQAAEARRPGDPRRVYMVIPYETLVSTDEYLAYAEGYVIPQMRGWMESGALQSYDIYMPRYAAGRGLDAEIVQGYRGDAGLAARDNVVQKVRARLGVTSPEWKALADSKKKLRIEKQAIIADDLADDGQ